jgi:hypothetical protein
MFTDPYRHPNQNVCSCFVLKISIWLPEFLIIIKSQRISCEKALVLAGGGARGSYQAGVLQYLWERKWIPDIICGSSVGALNAVEIAFEQSLVGSFNTVLADPVLAIDISGRGIQQPAAVSDP